MISFSPDESIVICDHVAPSAQFSPYSWPFRSVIGQARLTLPVNQFHLGAGSCIRAKQSQLLIDKTRPKPTQRIFNTGDHSWVPFSGRNQFNGTLASAPPAAAGSGASAPRATCQWEAQRKPRILGGTLFGGGTHQQVLFWIVVFHRPPSRVAC